MNRNSKGPKSLIRGRSAAAVSALALVLLFGSGGTWATASSTDSGAATSQPTNSTQAEEAAAPEALSQTPVDDVGELVETPAAVDRTGGGAGENSVDTPTVEPVATPIPQVPASSPVEDGAGAVAKALSETAEETALADDLDGGIALFAVDASALFWTVKEENALIGGAKFDIERRSSNSWVGRTVIEDCVEATAANCTGPDSDPVAGQFKVIKFSTHDVATDTRYQIRQNVAPSGFRYTNAANSWNNRNAGWSSPYTFGNFAVTQVVPAVPSCEPGYVYGLNGNGRLRQVASGQGAATNFGLQADGVSSFNGLGIGLDGVRVFAYERNDDISAVEIWSFDTPSGVWTTTGVAVNSTTGSRTVGFVAGAVDLSTGRYYLGGFSGNGQAFRIWEYVPGALAATYKGYIDTSKDATSTNNNGDMAFDSSGNLFVVRGKGTSTTIFSATQANFQAANANRITAAPSSSVVTMGSVNGVAFDSNGKGYLGAADELRSYDMPGWTNGSTVVSSGLSSTDLATCSSPPTVTLEKSLPGGRAKAADQFKLELKQGETLIGDATTSGAAGGVQEQRVGPLPVRPLAVLQISEKFVSGAVPSDYATSWRCSADGVQIPSLEGVGSNGTITIPVNAKAVVCQFTNSLLVASVKIHKDVVDIGATGPSPGPLWTVGTTATSTSVGTAMVDPAGTQVTNEMGDASWDVRFSSINGKADVTVFEEMQGGYEFVEGSCVVQPLGGSPSAPQPITNFTGKTLAGIGPGDTVSCTLLNKQLPASVEVDKQWIINGGAPVAHGLQPDGLTAALTLDPDLDAAPVWGEARTGFAVNDEVTIGETAALDSELLPGCSLGAAIISGDRISDGTPLGSGVGVALTEATNSYTITNPVTCKQELTLVKTVVNSFTGERLPSDWLLDSGDWDGELFAHMGEDASLTFDSAETKTVAEGEYVITETAMPNYVFDNLTCVGGDLDEDTMAVAVDLGQLVTCTFTNKDAPGSVTWTKVDEAGVLLSGSEWRLESVGGDVATIVDCVEESAECTGYDKDPAAGQFKIEGLAWGEYSLVETKAPAGFVLNPDPHEFTISMAQGDYVFEDGIVNEQRDPLVIPMTGGLGSYQFWMTAGFFGVLAAGGLLWQRRGQRRTVAVLRN